MILSPDTCWRGRAAELVASGGYGITAATIGRLGRQTLSIVFFVLLGLSSGAPLQAAEPAPEADQTIVVQLHNRPAEEVMGALQAHAVGRPVSLSAHGDRILLHGPTRDLGVLADLISAIDIPVNMLWITVAREPFDIGARTQAEPANTPMQRRFGAGGTPAIQDVAEVGSAVSNRWTTRREDASRVLVQEGQWASLEVQGVPIDNGFSAQVQVSPFVEVFLPNPTRSPDALGNGGFRARPRLIGNQVTVEVQFYRTTEAPRSGEPQVQSERSVLTGGLGEWMPLGSRAHAQPETAPGELVARTRPRGLPDLWVRVDPAQASAP